MAAVSAASLHGSSPSGTGRSSKKRHAGEGAAADDLAAEHKAVSDSRVRKPLIQGLSIVGVLNCCSLKTTCEIVLVLLTRERSGTCQVAT